MTEAAEQTEPSAEEIQAAHDEAYREAMEDHGDEAGGPDDYGHAEADDSEISKVRKEAAGYRRKLREAEAEIERQAGLIGDLQRAEVERRVTWQGSLRDGSDFWLAVQLDDLRDDEAGLDPAKIKAARDRILREHPHWREPGPNFDAGARQPPPERPPSLGEALKKAAG